MGGAPAWFSRLSICLGSGHDPQAGMEPTLHHQAPCSASPAPPLLVFLFTVK